MVAHQTACWKVSCNAGAIGIEFPGCLTRRLRMNCTQPNFSQRAAVRCGSRDRLVRQNANAGPEAYVFGNDSETVDFQRRRFC